MQEVNSLCTDSGPLRVNTVLRHSTQYSLLVYLYVLHYDYCTFLCYWLRYYTVFYVRSKTDAMASLI